MREAGRGRADYERRIQASSLASSAIGQSAQTRCAVGNFGPDFLSSSPPSSFQGIEGDTHTFVAPSLVF